MHIFTDVLIYISIVTAQVITRLGDPTLREASYIGRISRLREGRLKPHLQELNPRSQVSKSLVRIGGL